MRKLASFLYGIAIQIRNTLYDHGILKVCRAAVPVVSIGNIEAGGTGKTPFTITLARELIQRGFKPAIVTRGYKGKLTGAVHVKPDHHFSDVGDEALLMARVSGAEVIKSPDRVKGAAYAAEVLHADLVLLDDGFQHRRLHRDLDIVLVSRDVSREALLPLGPLREPFDALKRADFVVHTKGAAGGGITAELVPDSLKDAEGMTHDLSILKGKRVLAVSGIARPEFFLEAITVLGAGFESVSFGDHHAFTQKDIDTILAKSKAFDFVVTTEKDMMRIETFGPNAKWLALAVQMRITGGETILREVEGIVRNSRIHRQG